MRKMASKEFISARIPKDLLNKIEYYAELKGESKSKILIEAIKKYLACEESTAEEELSSQEAIESLRRWIDFRLGNLEEKVLSLEHIEEFLSSQLGNRDLTAMLPQKGDSEIRYLPKPRLLSSSSSLEKSRLSQFSAKVILKGSEEFEIFVIWLLLGMILQKQHDSEKLDETSKNSKELSDK